MTISKDKIIKNIVYSDIKLINKSELLITGIVNGNIYISDNSICIIKGIVKGKIDVSTSCELIINGIFEGSLINYGLVTITGILKLKNKTGKLKVKKGSIINGVDYKSDALI